MDREDKLLIAYLKQMKKDKQITSHTRKVDGRTGRGLKKQSQQNFSKVITK